MKQTCRKLAILLTLLGNISSLKATCVYEFAILRCGDTDVETLIPELNDAAIYNSLIFVEQLELRNISFENQTMKSGWLSGIRVKFDALTIISTNLKTITPRAFGDSCFSSLKVLTLSGNELEILSNGAFDGLHLDTINFYNYNYQELIIEKNTFDSVSHSLRALTLTRCVTNEALLNITGPGTNLPYLQRLFVSYGQLGDLKAVTFVGVPKLKVLYIDNCFITSIEEGTFDYAVLELLHLGGNLLTTLPNNIFRYVLSGIYIDPNLWHCDCNLVWLRDMFTNFHLLFGHRDFYCTVGHTMIAYDQVDFCPNKYFY